MNSNVRNLSQHDETSEDGEKGQSEAWRPGVGGGGTLQWFAITHSSQSQSDTHQGGVETEGFPARDDVENSA